MEVKNHNEAGRGRVGVTRVAGALVMCMVALSLLVFVYESPISNPALEISRGSFASSWLKMAPGGSTKSSNAVVDKLLGGLLSLDFDKESCLSRYDRVFYQKPTHHIPSPYLIKILRNYEILHKKCGPSTQQYNKSIAQLHSDHIHNNGTLECRYVVWLHNCGLGNRILSLASTFLYSLVTNRVLLIEKNGDINDLFCEPFPSTSWLLPSNFPLLPFQGSYLNHPRSYGSLLRNKQNKTGLPSYVYLHLTHDYGEHDKQFFCDDDQLYLQRIPWLVLLSNQYFLPSLFQLSIYEEELNRMFADKETIFFHLVNYLFHPNNEVWGLITRFYDGYLANADKRIGIQVRVFDKHTIPYVVDHIIACTSNQHLVPKANLKDPLPHSKNATRSEAILITSLSASFYDSIKNLYWEHPATNGEIISVYQPSHEEWEQNGNKMHEMKALAEIYLLGMTDELITSAMSTFGYVAQGIGGLKSWILSVGKTKSPRESCKRSMGIEPCYHYPPYYDCKAKRVNASLALPSYLMHCEDHLWGLKLVN